MDTGHNLMRRDWIVRLSGPAAPASFIAVCAIALLANQTIGGTVNNGDFSRVFQSMAIHADAWQVLRPHYEFLPGPPLATPASTMGAFGWLLSSALMGIGAHGVNTLLLAAALQMVYLSGLITLTRIAPAARLVAGTTVLVAVGYGFYFRSLFEEAAVLALAPWLAASIVHMHRTGRSAPFLLSASAIILAKAQMVFVLPLLLLMLHSGMQGSARRRRWIVVVLGGSTLIAVAAGYASYLAQTGGMTPINEYNRMYNGIGWALQSSADWPASNFNERLTYFYDHKTAIQQATRADEPLPGRSLLGTTYWPTGAEISARAWAPNATATDRSRVAEVFSQGKFGPYFQYVDSHPSIVPDLVGNTYLTALTSDYSMGYVRNPQTKNTLMARTLSAIGSVSLQWVLLTVTALALRRRSWAAVLIAVYYLLGAPLFVVLGDGYFEFEKHMAPYLMLAPAILAAMWCNHGIQRRPGTRLAT